MTDIELLQALIARGVVSEEQGVFLKKDITIAGRGLEDLIYERHIVDDAKVATVKSELLGVPYQKVDTASVDGSLFAIIPEDTMRTYRVAPLSKQDTTLVVGMVNPADPKAQEALRFIARRNRVDLGVYLIAYSDFQELLRRVSPYKSTIESAVRSIGNAPGAGGGRKAIRLDEDIAKGGEEAPIIKIVSDTFREAVQSKASDIHLEPQENYLRIRFRIDGVLHEVATLPPELGQPVISRVKVIASLKIDETRVPQDGRFRAKVADRDIDFRVSTFPTPLGEKIAIRVLDPSTGLKSFASLGLAGGNLKAVEEGLAKPFGMILITGPTGSGKTTTLYALLSQLNKESANIVSLEDPVEYFVAGMNQSQVHPEIGYDFASGLREILRQDPDIIMVGEIRDRETAGLAVQAALTGHIVLSTLHTNNAAGVIPRLLDMGVEKFLLPVSLNLIMSQRLVGRLCESCKKGEPASPEIQKVIERALAGISEEMRGKYAAPYTVYRSEGCVACNNRGIVGRVAIYEALRMSKGLEDVVGGNPTSQSIMKEAKQQGMLTLREDGILKALEGIISVEEVIRSTEEEE
jgi:type IV pilus assembly protein PilB